MSASIWWTPKQKTYLSGYTSDLASALHKAYGSFPVTLTEESIPVLLGMKFAGLEIAEALIDALHEHGSIIVGKEV